MASGVLTFGAIEGGTAENIIADRVALEGTIRYFDPEVRDRLREALDEALAVASALGGGHELDLREGYPPTINDPELSRLAMDAAGSLLGDDGVWEAEPMMGTEDFAILWLGAAPSDGARELHRPDMDIDEDVLPIGAAVLAACAIETLRDRAGT